MKPAFLALPLLLAGAAPPPAERIAMTAKSWGRPLIEWSIEPDGAITRTVAQDRGSTDFRRYTLVTTTLPPSAPRYRWVAQQLAPVRARLSRPLPCEQRMTDQVYGEVSWGTRGSAVTLAYDNGCTDAETRAVLRRLQQADAQVARWAAGAPVASTREITP